MKLVKYEAARHALAEAHRVDEAKAIRDKAVALIVYAKQCQDKQLIFWATEIRLRAERRAGELLKETAATRQRERPGGDRKSSSSRDDNARKPTLASLGLSRDQSSDFQQLASIPAGEFENRIKAAHGNPAALATERMLQKPRPEPVPLFDLKGRDPDEFELATRAQGVIRRLAEFVECADIEAVARGLSAPERAALAAQVGIVMMWLRHLAAAIKG